MTPPFVKRGRFRAPDKLLAMLKSTVEFYREYLPPDLVADEVAAFLADLDEESWERLTEVIPIEIAEADPASFGEYAGIRAADLVGVLQDPK